MFRYNLLFFVSGGGKFNYQGTKRWLEDNLDHTGTARSCACVSRRIEVDLLNSPVFCRLQSATGQCCFCVVSGHGGQRRHPAPSCVQTSQRRNASILSAQRAGVGKESNTLSAELGNCPCPDSGLKALTHGVNTKWRPSQESLAIPHFSYSESLVIVVL